MRTPEKNPATVCLLMASSQKPVFCPGYGHRIEGPTRSLPMVKPKFLSVVQDATDHTDFPLELEAIEWAINSPYRQTRPFQHHVIDQRMEETLEDMICVGAWLKDEQGPRANHTLLFHKRDWARMSLKQLHQVFQLLERVVMGKQPNRIALPSQSLVFQ
jgi:hypothetical protein